MTMNNTMHVLLCRREALDVPDGINVFIFSLAEQMINLGAKVSVLSTVKCDENKVHRLFSCDVYPEFYSLVRRRELSIAGAAAVWALKARQLIRKLNPSAVLLNGVVPTRLPAPTWALSHDLERRGGRLSPFRVPYKRLSYRLADRLAATCSEVRDGLASELGADPGSIAVLPTCINSDAYSCRPLNERRPAILHMGAAHYKNVPATLRWFAELGETDAELYITGDAGRQVEAAKPALSPQALRRIHLVGDVSHTELKALLTSVRAVAVPSDYACPVASPTVLEAFASGTPVVASASISRDVLRDGENGHCVPELSGALGPGRLRELLSDDTVWKRMSAAALATARSFSSARVAKVYLGQFERPASQQLSWRRLRSGAQ
jgi:glycosyltransferase involved in cell wall biosynthesis